MRLIKVLDIVNQIEKSSFLKILDGFCLDLRKEKPKIDKILAEGAGEIKKVDDTNIVDLFNLLSDQYYAHLEERIQFSDYHLDILVDVLIRDGNSIMSREWFSRLYNDQLSKLRTNIKTFSSQLTQEKSDISPERKRDYLIYQTCVKTGYENDLLRNREEYLSWEEKSILQSLARSLELSNEEIRWISYSVIPPSKFNIDDIITELKESGIIFYSRKNSIVYVPDEIIWLLRKIMGIEIPNKFLRRILRNLTDPEINMVAKKHTIQKGLTRNNKIQEILAQGVNVSDLLVNEIFKVDIPKSKRAIRIQTLMEKDLEIKLPSYGRSLEDKVHKVIQYFNNVEKDESMSLPRDGYDKMLKDLKKKIPRLNNRVKKEFQLQPEDVLIPELLNDYTIKPRDILYLLTKDEIRGFCRSMNIPSRGTLVSNVLKNYRNIDDLFIENYELVGGRDLKALRERSLEVKESELGILYEKLAKKIFSQLGFDVNESLRKSLSTQKHQMDIVLDLGKQDVIIVECKTKKDKQYNQYTAISRQLKSYQQLCQNKGYHVLQVLVIANDFSQEFIGECEYDYEINLSLLTSVGLKTILNGLKESRHIELPVRLLLKDGLLDADRIVRVLNK